MYSKSSILAQILRNDEAAAPTNSEIKVNIAKVGKYPWTFNQL